MPEHVQPWVNCKTSELRVKGVGSRVWGFGYRVEDGRRSTQTLRTNFRGGADRGLQGHDG